jgi:hypothetical protein
MMRCMKLAIIQTVLSIAASRSWPIRQLNMKNAFLNDHLDETVYCMQPSGLIDCVLHATFRLLKSLYVLKQVLRAWYKPFVTNTCALGFKGVFVSVFYHFCGLAFERSKSWIALKVRS